MSFSDELHHAVMRGDLDAFETLTGAGASPSDLTEKERWNYLHMALLTMWRSPPVDMVHRLIAWGVDVDAVDMYRNTPLHYAARMSAPEAPEIIRLLVAAGADIEALNCDRITPLRAALVDKGTFGALLAAGADMNQRSPGGRSVREVVELNPRADPGMKELIAQYAARLGS